MVVYDMTAQVAKDIKQSCPMANAVWGLYAG